MPVEPSAADTDNASAAGMPADDANVSLQTLMQRTIFSANGRQFQLTAVAAEDGPSSSAAQHLKNRQRHGGAHAVPRTPPSKSVRMRPSAGARPAAAHDDEDEVELTGPERTHGRPRGSRDGKSKTGAQVRYRRRRALTEACHAADSVGAATVVHSFSNARLSQAYAVSVGGQFIPTSSRSDSMHLDEVRYASWNFARRLAFKCHYDSKGNDEPAPLFHVSDNVELPLKIG